MAARVDAEYHAFRAGLKPAIRLSAGAGESAALVARYAALGCAVVTSAGVLTRVRSSEARAIELVYVARSRADAEALRDVEAPLLEGSDSLPVDDAARACREVGLRLGYPPCCVEACSARYVRRRRRSSEDPGLDAAQAYLAARDAWIAAPRWQLDDLLFAARASVISFEPCSYACDPATRYADAVLVVIASFDPEARAVLERTLRQAVAIDRHGARAVASIEGGRVASAAPLCDPRGRPLDPASVRLAEAIAGAPLAADGTLAGTGDPPVLVVDFSLARRG